MNTTESAGNNFSGMFASLGGVAANFLQDKMLKKMDGDGNGSVNVGEFKAALELVGTKLGVDTGDAARAEGMFASVDANGDGELIGSEVGQMLKNMFSPQSGTDAFVQSRGDEQRFAELDADGDGSISMAEFGIESAGSDEDAVVADSVDPATGESTASADASATASLNEDAMQTLLGQVDSDGDGQISQTELTAFVTQLGTQMQAASQKYNETALASFSTKSLNTAA